MMSIGSGVSKPSLVIRIAVKMSGICPSGNSQSTAGPATWTTLPTTTPLEVDIISLFGRGCAADHFDNFLGDTALPHAVHVEREAVDHIGGVGTCRIHGGHARRMLAG